MKSYKRVYIEPPSKIEEIESYEGIGIDTLINELKKAKTTGATHINIREVDYGVSEVNTFKLVEMTRKEIKEREKNNKNYLSKYIEVSNEMLEQTDFLSQYIRNRKDG